MRSPGPGSASLLFSSVFINVLVLGLLHQVSVSVSVPDIGFHIKSRLKERRSSNDTVLRKSLCPNLAENVSGHYRYDLVSRKCYRGGDRGPCGQNMIFFGETENRVYGFCDCDNKSLDRALIFHPGTNQCYFVFSRGYCSSDQWLTFDSKDLPICELNRCRQDSGNNGVEFVPFGGSCVELGSECGGGKVIGFKQEQLGPVCDVEQIRITQLSIMVPKFRCSPGSARSIFGNCRPVVKYNLT